MARETKVADGLAGMPQYGIDKDYPQLYDIAMRFDFAERLGGSTDTLAAEVDAALRELWDARRHLRSRGR